MGHENEKIKGNVSKKKTNETAAGSILLMSEKDLLSLKRINFPQKEEDHDEGERDRNGKNNI
eukprot:341257-Amphidinium_carterae.1